MGPEDNVSSYMLETPRTPIPEEFEWIHATSTPEERANLLSWAYTAAYALEEKEDHDESDRLIEWAVSLTSSTIAEYPAPQAYNRYLLLWSHSISENAAPDERKRLFKWKHSALRSATPDEHKRWSLQEEILKAFETALQFVQIDIEKRYAVKFSDTDLRQEHTIYSCKGEPGLYQCQNALWIWPELIRWSTSCKLDSELFSGPRIVAESIKRWIPRSDMIEEEPFTNEVGYVTIKLSGKWIAKSIHKMLTEGIDTWAPKLTVKRVIVDCPSSDVEMRDWFRLLPIVYTFMSILEYSKVDVTLAHRMDLPKSFHLDGKLFHLDGILDRWFQCEERGGYVMVKGKVPFILPKTDLENAYKDIFALGHGICVQKADWMVYVTPIQQQVYTEMCLEAAKLEGWIPNDRQKPPRASYVGYRSCNKKVTKFRLERAKRRYERVLEGRDAMSLGYLAEEVLDCVYRYAALVNHRLAVCMLDVEMFDEQENNFIYLLETRARILRITNDYRADILDLKKSSELILEKDEGWENSDERMLGFHLLKFTEVLEESCLSVLPHILCEYLYVLAEKFNTYHSSVYEDGSFADTSTLLLYEATDAVMEKCFHLLGLSPGVATEKFVDLRRGLLLSTVEEPMDLLSTVEEPMDPTANFRFELFSFDSLPGTPLWKDRKGWIFGQISATDKFCATDEFGGPGSHFSEPDFAHVSLFKEDWCNRIRIVNSGLVYVGNPSSGHPVSFSRYIKICLELYIVTDNWVEGYQVCDHEEDIDLSEFWENKSDGLCGCLTVAAEKGHACLYYMLLRDAIDTALEIKFATREDGFSCKVRGYIVAHYGDDFLYDSQSQSETICKDCYMALLFRSEPPSVLEAGIIPLIKSVLAVPKKGSLIVKAYMEDAESGKVIIDGCSKFKPLLDGHISDTIVGKDGCSLGLKVSWNFLARYI